MSIEISFRFTFPPSAVSHPPGADHVIVSASPQLAAIVPECCGQQLRQEQTLDRPGPVQAGFRVEVVPNGDRPVPGPAEPPEAVDVRPIVVSSVTESETEDDNSKAPDSSPGPRDDAQSTHSMCLRSPRAASGLPSRPAPYTPFGSRGDDEPGRPMYVRTLGEASRAPAGTTLRLLEDVRTMAFHDISITNNLRQPLVHKTIKTLGRARPSARTKSGLTRSHRQGPEAAESVRVFCRVLRPR
jgi:hypothetical protein